jgi:hypothetical protein
MEGVRRNTDGVRGEYVEIRKEYDASTTEAGERRKGVGDRLAFAHCTYVTWKIRGAL